MKRGSRGIIVIGLLLVVTGLFGYQQVQASYEVKAFLVEAHATYDLSFTLPGSVSSIPTRISLWTHGESGDFLHMSKLHRGLESQDSVDLQFITPVRANRASVRVYTNEGLTDGSVDQMMSIARSSHIDASNQDGLFQLVVDRQVYTGLIVDARGLGLQRGISPRVWSESGELIYGGVVASYDYVQQQGVVSYGRELSSNMVQRVSVPGRLSYTSPLTIVALDVAGPARTEVIISQNDARRIFEAAKKYDFFAHYAVVFLID